MLFTSLHFDTSLHSLTSLTFSVRFCHLLNIFFCPDWIILISWITAGFLSVWPSSDRCAPVLDRCAPVLDRYAPVIDRYAPVLDRYAPVYVILYTTSKARKEFLWPSNESGLFAEHFEEVDFGSRALLQEVKLPDFSWLCGQSQPLKKAQQRALTKFGFFPFYSLQISLFSSFNFILQSSRIPFFLLTILSSFLSFIYFFTYIILTIFIVMLSHVMSRFFHFLYVSSRSNIKATRGDAYFNLLMTLTFWSSPHHRDLFSFISSKRVAMINRGCSRVLFLFMSLFTYRSYIILDRKSIIDHR